MNVIYHHKVLLQTWLYWFSKQFLWYRKDRKPNIVPFNVKSVWSEEETGGKWLLYYDSFLPTTSAAYLMHFSYSSYPWMILVVLRSGAEQLHRLMWEVAAPTIASSSPPAASPREVSFVIIQRSCLTSSPTLIQRHSQPGQPVADQRTALLIHHFWLIMSVHMLIPCERKGDNSEVAWILVAEPAWLSDFLRYKNRKETEKLWQPPASINWVVLSSLVRRIVNISTWKEKQS